MGAVGVEWGCVPKNAEPNEESGIRDDRSVPGRKKDRETERETEREREAKNGWRSTIEGKLPGEGEREREKVKNKNKKEKKRKEKKESVLFLLFSFSLF